MKSKKILMKRKNKDFAVVTTVRPLASVQNRGPVEDI